MRDEKDKATTSDDPTVVALKEAASRSSAILSIDGESERSLEVL
jgi:hypothetical protein